MLGTGYAEPFITVTIDTNRIVIKNKICNLINMAGVDY